VQDGPSDFPKLSVRLHGRLDARRCVNLARAAEANGFHSLWFAENPFERGVLPAAAACAVATSRLGIGIGVFNPYNRHPTLMAMEIGALDELARGRVRLGIGSGIAAATERMGLSPDRPLAAVRDAFTIVRAMLRGEEVIHAGGLFSAGRARLGFNPLRPDVPLLMAARGQQALTLCGKIADGLLISNMCPPEFTRHAVNTAAAAAAAAQRSPLAHIVQYVPCAVGRDRNSAHALAKDAIAEMLPSYWALAQRVPAARSALLQANALSDVDFGQALARLGAGERAGDVLDERFISAFAIAGTPADCVGQARRYRAAGATELALTFVGPDPEGAMKDLGQALVTAHPAPVPR
jgi:5,10-methylenetetrahydromethanopterin reductase